MGVVVECWGLSCAHWGKQTLFLLGPAQTHSGGIRGADDAFCPQNLKNHLSLIKASLKIPFIISLKITNLPYDIPRYDPY